MSEKCFVPNCKNISGVSFPRDPKLKKEWLDGLRIRKLVPKTTDFVCLDHFKESDLSNDPAQPGAGMLFTMFAYPLAHRAGQINALTNHRFDS